ncbi:MAG: DUF6788 family protein [Acidimicrobiales bacterium]
MTATAAERQASCERRYRDLARQLSEIGWIASGSLALRADRCGKPNCACASDPARRHGPYWHLTAKVDGKTVNKRLSEHEAQLYQHWIANDRAVRAVLAEMRAIAAEAQALILADQAPKGARDPRTPSPQTRRAAARRSA